MASAVTKRILALSAILWAAAIYLISASRTEPTPIRESLEHFPLRIGGWQGTSLPEMNPRVLAALGVDDFINAVYYRPGSSQVGLYIGYYQSQREGDTIHSPLNCLPGAGWNPVRRRHERIPVDGGEIEVNLITIQKGRDRQVVVYWYQSQGRAVASEYWSKIYLVLDAIRNNRTDAALVRVISPVEGSEGSAEKNAIEFVKLIYPFLSRYLPD